MKAGKKWVKCEISSIALCGVIDNGSDLAVDPQNGSHSPVLATVHTYATTTTTAAAATTTTTYATGNFLHKEVPPAQNGSAA